MLCNFIEITLWHWFSPVNLLMFSEHSFLTTLLGAASEEKALGNFSRHSSGDCQITLSLNIQREAVKNKMTHIFSKLWYTLLIKSVMARGENESGIYL